jgi:preprotein translocase subunit SecA
VKILESSILSQVSGSSQKFLSVILSLIDDPKFLELSDLDILRILRETINSSYFIPMFYQILINELVLYNKKQQDQENKIVKNLGGLYIVGTERNDSRDELIINCEVDGRQGDPGTSRFF